MQRHHKIFCHGFVFDEVFLLKYIQDKAPIWILQYRFNILLEMKINLDAPASLSNLVGLV